MQIGESAGPECKAALQEVNSLVEQRLSTNGKALKTLFGAAEVCILFYVQHAITDLRKLVEVHYVAKKLCLASIFCPCR